MRAATSGDSVTNRVPSPSNATRSWSKAMTWMASPGQSVRMSVCTALRTAVICPRIEAERSTSTSTSLTRLALVMRPTLLGVRMAPQNLQG